MPALADRIGVGIALDAYEVLRVAPSQHTGHLVKGLLRGTLETGLAGGEQDVARHGNRHLARRHRRRDVGDLLEAGDLGLRQRWLREHRLGVRKAGKLPVPQRGLVLGQGGVPRRKLHPQVLVRAGQQDVRLLKVGTAPGKAHEAHEDRARAEKRHP